MKFFNLKNLNVEDLKIAIELEKDNQIEAFKNGKVTQNWHGKNINIIDKNFVNREELVTYASENCKEDEIIVAQLFDYPFYEDTTQKAFNLFESILKQQEELSHFKENLIKKVKEQKSQTKTCTNPDCKSVIKIDKIEHIYCPVCHSNDFLLTETTHKSLENKLKKLMINTKKFEEDSEKYYDKCRKEVEDYLEKEYELIENMSFEDANKSLKYSWIVCSKD